MDVSLGVTYGSLDEILARLGTDQARYTVLERLYFQHPGDFVIARALLGLPVLSRRTRFMVIDQEQRYAKEHGLGDRLVVLAKEEIDVCVNDPDFRGDVDQIVMRENNPEITEYALLKLTSFSEDHPYLRQALLQAKAIAAAKVKPSEEAITLRLIGHAVTTGDFSGAARLAESAGKYDQALAYYLQSNTNYDLESALKLAEEHVQERVGEVAKRGYEQYNEHIGYIDFYFKCAKIIGKQAKAKKRFIKMIKDMVPANNPRAYTSIIKRLQEYKQHKLAEQLVDKVAEQQRLRGAKYSSDYETDVDIGNLYLLVGEITKAVEMYVGVIDFKIKQRHRTDEVLKIIDRAFNATNNTILLERKIQVFEMEGNYGQAAIVAEQLKKPEQVTFYTHLQGMVGSVTGHFD